MRLIITFSVFIPFFIAGCSKYPREVEQVLKQAGKNRTELEAVIEYYNRQPADSLKLKAAYFLISNMAGHYFYDDEILKNYSKYFDDVLNQKEKGQEKSLFQKYENEYGYINISELHKVYDMHVIKSQYLINNIDFAFKVWREQPWGKKVTFKIFCDFILPYRLDDEPIEKWRETIYKSFNPYLDSIRAAGGNSVTACMRLCTLLRDSFSSGSQQLGGLPSQGPAKLLKYRMGTCRDDAHFIAYIMRAVGIPVSIEFTPQWPFRSMGHKWNAVFDSLSNAVKFTGTVAMPGEYLRNKDDYKCAKIYRQTYSVNPYSLIAIAKKVKSIPEVFKNSHIWDVTKDFVQVKTITLNIKKTDSKAKIVYLTVFNNQDWVPIAWAIINGNTVSFTNIGLNIVYLPVCSNENALYVVGNPFILSDKKVTYYVPDANKSETLTLRRKYPYFKRIDDFIKRMKGGKFQVANKSDFSDAVSVYTIDSIPDPVYYTLPIDIKLPYRYIRYLSPNGGWGNIAEMEVYDNNGKELKGVIIGTNGTWEGTDRTKGKAFDKDILSFFDASLEDGVWVGVDFGTKKELGKIKFMPRNDGNIIEVGDLYELVYWDNEWKSISNQNAKTDSLVFTNVPSGALYLLHNRSKGKEERPFTYENEKQVWW